MIQNTAVYFSGTSRALIGVLLFGFLLNTAAIDWGIPNIHSWNPDDIAPAKPLRVVQTYTHGWDKYPLLQSWVDFVLFQPLLLYWSADGTFKPGCESNIEACFGDPYGQLSILLILSRLLSTLMAAGAVYWIYRISLLVFQDRLAAVLGALVLTTSNVFVFSAHVGNVDVPYLFWFSWSIYHYLRIVQTNQTKHYIAFGFLSACALATKEAIIGAYVLVGFFIYVLYMRGAVQEMQRISIRSVLKIHIHGRLVGLLAALLLTYAIINNVVFNWDGYVKHFTFWVGSNSPGVGPYSKRDLGTLWLLKQFVVHLRAGMGQPLFFLCAAGSVYGLVRDWQKAVLLIIPAVSYYVFSIHTIHFSLIRYGLPVVVILAIFGGALAARLCRVRPPRIWLCIPIVIIVFLHGFLKSANVVWVMRNDSRYLTEQWLLNHVPKTTTMGVFSFPTYLPRFGLLGYQVDRIPSENLTVGYLEEKGPPYLALTSKYYSGFRGEQRELLDALFGGKLNYRQLWDYRYESPLKPIVGEWYVSGFINPRITIFKRIESAAK